MVASPGFPESVRAFAERFALLPEGAVVVALVSGGADSTALLRLLTDGHLNALGALRVLHVNHLLRGEASDADEAFVVELCGHLSVPCSAVRYDVASYAAEEGLNLEDAGRRVRYSFAEEELDALLASVGAAPGTGRIAVAHTLDDRIETFFMRVLAGAGAGGLSSIAPVRGRVVRPLLGSRRAEVRAWLGEQGHQWREDASNLDLERLRVSVRQVLVPAAEEVVPGFAKNLARTMDLLGEEDALLQEMADAFARDFADVRDGELRFRRQLMLTLTRPMARRTIRSALLGAFPEAARIEFEHLEALADGLADDQFARDLPYGLRASTEYDTMVLARAEEERKNLEPALLPIPGTANLGEGGRISAEETGPDDAGWTDRSIVIDATDLRGDLVVDAVRSGDRMKPFGMAGSKKLSDLLVDAKVPRRVRSTVPVVRDGDRIVWLAGVRMSEEYRVGHETRRAVRLTWTPDTPERPDGHATGSDDEG